MFLEARSISKIIVLTAIGAALSLGGCTTATEKAQRKLKPNEPVSETYFAPYEEVEAALKQAMIRYPQRIDNTEAGIFETDYVKGESRFTPAHETRELSSGYRYRLLVRMVRGKKDSRSAVRVSITKQVQLARDFFADPETLTSDGLEEKAVLYRIGRELTIARAIARAGEKSQH